MKVSIDAKEFAGVLTAYEFEGKWAKYGNPKSRLVNAVVKPSKEVERGNNNRVFLLYENESHAFTLQEVADFLFVDRVIIGKWGKMNVLCLVPKKGVRK